jgi:hypothetical protein
VQAEPLGNVVELTAKQRVFEEPLAPAEYVSKQVPQVLGYDWASQGLRCSAVQLGVFRQFCEENVAATTLHV